MFQPTRFRIELRAVAALAALLGGHALAQDSAPAAAVPAASATATPQPVDEVIVRGRRLSEIEADLRIEVGKFLAEVAAPTRGRGYARWYRRVCVGVHNLEHSAAQYVVDRISRAALDVGLEPGEPGCNPEVNVVFATNAQETAAFMVEREPRAFRPFGPAGSADLGRDALDAFVKSDKAVRWWHVSYPVSGHDRTLAMETPTNRTCGQAFCPPTVRVQGPSRVHDGVVDEMQYVIVIVDATKLTGTTWQQLGDYLAVVSLAQIDMNADPAEFDSILNLFTNPRAYSGLTDWDRSYLQALYDFSQERVAERQRSEIVGRIAALELERRP